MKIIWSIRSFQLYQYTVNAFVQKRVISNIVKIRKTVESHVYFHFYNGCRSPYRLSLTPQIPSTQDHPLIHIVVCLLLFLLSLSIGLNRLIVDNLVYFCGQAAVISH